MEEFYFVVEGVGRIRIGEQTLTGAKAGRRAPGTERLRQVFNDTETEVLLAYHRPPRRRKLEAGETPEPKLLYPVDPKQLPSIVGGSCVAARELIDG